MGVKKIEKTSIPIPLQCIFLVANMLAGTIKPTERDFAYLLVLTCHSKVEKCCKFGIWHGYVVLYGKVNVINCFLCPFIKDLYECPLDVKPQGDLPALCLDMAYWKT